MTFSRGFLLLVIQLVVMFSLWPSDGMTMARKKGSRRNNDDTYGTGTALKPPDLLDSGESSDTSPYTPKFLAEPPKLLYTHKGRPALIHCVAKPATYMNIICVVIDDKRLKATYSIEEDQRYTINLTVSEEVVDSWFGDFYCYCEAWNQVRPEPKAKITSKIYIQVAYMEKRFQREPISVNIELKSNTELGCLPPDSKPAPTIHWQKDGIRLLPHLDPNFIVTGEGSLVINQARLQDRGNYTCVAENAAGLMRKSEPATVNVIVNGGWSDFSPWTECPPECIGRSICSPQCTQSKRTRRRQCNDPKPLNGGKKCQGLELESELCLADCFQHGGWSMWSDWGVCRQNCLQTRHRICNNPLPRNGGNNCGPTSDGIQFRNCSIQYCPKALSEFPVLHPTHKTPRLGLLARDIAMYVGLFVAVAVLLIVVFSIIYLIRRKAEENQSLRYQIGGDSFHKEDDGSTKTRELLLQPDLTQSHLAKSKSSSSCGHAETLTTPLSTVPHGIPPSASSLTQGNISTSSHLLLPLSLSAHPVSSAGMQPPPPLSNCSSSNNTNSLTGYYSNNKMAYSLHSNNNNINLQHMQQSQQLPAYKMVAPHNGMYTNPLPGSNPYYHNNGNTIMMNGGVGYYNSPPPQTSPAHYYQQPYQHHLLQGSTVIPGAYVNSTSSGMSSPAGRTAPVPPLNPSISHCGPGAFPMNTSMLVTSVATPPMPRNQPLSSPSIGVEAGVAWGTITNAGGRLCLPDYDIALTIPPGAVPLGYSEEIFLALDTSENDLPQLKDDQTLLSSMIVCGPPCIHLSKPLVLTFPHCASLRQGSWELTVLATDPSLTEEENADWEAVVKLGQESTHPSSSYCHIDLEKCYLMTSQLRSFCLIGSTAHTHIPPIVVATSNGGLETTPNNPPETSAIAHKALRLVTFSHPIGNGQDFNIRVYALNDTKDVLETVIGSERNRVVTVEGLEEGGKLIDSPRQLLLKDNGESLCFRIEEVSMGWRSRQQSKYQEVAFSHLWSSCQPGLHTTFSLEHTDPTRMDLSCKIMVYQNNCYATRQIIKISCNVNQLHSFDSGKRKSHQLSYVMSPPQHVFRLSPKTRSELATLLNPQTNTGNDWRMLAQHLGIDRSISFFASQASPTDTILDLWESQHREETAIIDLNKIMRSIGRQDAAAWLI